jgi:hypothetical protein
LLEFLHTKKSSISKIFIPNLYCFLNKNNKIINKLINLNINILTNFINKTMQSNELALKDSNDFSGLVKNKNAIISVLQSYYGAFKIIYTIVQYKPNLERYPNAKPYWDMIQNELGEAVQRSQVEMKELDLVLQTFNMLAYQLNSFKQDISNYNLSVVLENSYPAVKELNNSTIPKCFENIARIQGVSLQNCKDYFEKLLPEMGAENFIAQQEELAKLKQALNTQIEAKNAVLSSEQYLKLSKEVETRRVNVVKFGVSVPALENEVQAMTYRETKLQKELEDIIINKEAYLKQIESTLENIDQDRNNEIEQLLLLEQNEQNKAKSQWDNKIDETQEMLKAIQEKIIDPDNGFIGGLKKCLNLAKPFMAIYNPFFLTQSFETGSKEPTTEELTKLTEVIEKQQRTYVELSRNDLENIQKKYENFTEKVNSKYEQMRQTSDKCKGNRELLWTERKTDLEKELTELKSELKQKTGDLASHKSELESNKEQLSIALHEFKDYVHTNMEDKQMYIHKLRNQIQEQEQNIMNDLKQVGQSTPQTAYHFLNAVQDMSRIIQVNIQLMGGASNFTTNTMKVIKIHFGNIDEVISKPDDNPRFWMDFLKYLNEFYENNLKCTWASIKNYTNNPNEENFKKLNFNHEDYAEDLKNSISDYYNDFKDQNNPINKNDKKKKDIEINCDKLYNIFNFSSLAKELEALK